MAEVPEQDEPRGRCRLWAAGHRVDDESWSVLLVIEETEAGSWEIHGLGAPRVRLTGEVMVSMATSILRCAHRSTGEPPPCSPRPAGRSA
ncbi:MAG: hypothetical protein ACRDRU_23100 [Pseudonocardiaceae bacterium]